MPRLFAAESGNIEELKLQLEVGMNPNVPWRCVKRWRVLKMVTVSRQVRDGYGRTPLHLAAWMGHVEDAWPRIRQSQPQLLVNIGSNM